MCRKRIAGHQLHDGRSTDGWKGRFKKKKPQRPEPSPSQLQADLWFLLVIIECLAALLYP
jgi:hypothetical protein